MGKLYIWAMPALCLLAVSLCAEEPIKVTLSSVEERIRNYNPELAAARWRIDEARGRHDQSGRLANPELSVGYSQDSRFGERELQVGLAQRFPLTSRLRLEKGVSDAEWKAVEQEVREVKRQLISEVRQRVIHILAIRERSRLLERQLEIARAFATFLGETASRGEGSSLDAAQAKVEADMLTLEIRQLQVEEMAGIGGLKPLLGVSPDQELEVTGELESPQLPERLIDLELRPDYQTMRYRMEAANQGVELEKSRKYEDVEVGFFAGVKREEEIADRYRTEGVFGIALTVPLPLWNRNEGAILEARARTRRMEIELSSLARKIRLEAETARAEMRQWAQLHREIEQNLFPLATEQTLAAEQAYSQGLVEIQTVFRARERRIQLDRARLDALRAFHLAKIRYESALGIEQI